MQFERGEPQKSFSWYMTLCGQRERKINAGNPGGWGGAENGVCPGLCSFRLQKEWNLMESFPICNAFLLNTNSSMSAGKIPL